MNKQEVKLQLESQYKLIQSIFEKENLISLSDNNYEYKELNFLSILNFRKENSEFKKFDIFKIKTDLLNCNNDLKLFTANLFLYLPFINNPLKEFRLTKNGKSFKYFKKMEDWLYSTNVSCSYEKLYNFWDRIGDVLAYCFELDIKEYRVGFANVIDELEKLNIYNENPNFIFLKKFRQTEFIEFNNHRKEIVHYYQFETTFSEKFFSLNNSEIEIAKLWEWKKNMPEYFKNQLKLSCDGYYNMHKFIETECLKQDE